MTRDELQDLKVGQDITEVSGMRSRTGTIVELFPGEHCRLALVDFGQGPAAVLVETDWARHREGWSTWDEFGLRIGGWYPEMQEVG